MKIPENSFQYHAYKLYTSVTEETEISKTNRTELFIKEIGKMIRDGEQIRMQIFGDPRTGKSTFGIHIAKNIIWENLKKHGYRRSDEEFGIRNVSRDQMEFAQKTRERKDMKHTVEVVDESNAMVTVGENTTAEDKYLTDWSNVNAGFYVHTVWISPSNLIDENVNIILKTRSKHNGKTIADLSYRFINPEGQRIIQYLGYVVLDVRELIKKWAEVEGIFFKEKRSEEEEKMLEEARRKDFYVEYMIKKYEKMNMLRERGISNPRQLMYAEPILNVIRNYEGLARIGVIDSDIIQTPLTEEYEKKRIPYTMLGIEWGKKKILAVLKMVRSLKKINAEISARKKKIRRGGLTEEEQERVLEELKELAMMRNEIEKRIKEQKDYYKNQKKIFEEYMTFLSKK